MVFYHFHNIAYRTAHEVNIGVYDPEKADKVLIERIYIPYLSELNDIKDELKKRYGIYPLLTVHPGAGVKNKTKKDIQSVLQDRLLFLKIYDRIYGTRKRAKNDKLNELII